MKNMKMIEEALERLREAESFVGSPVTRMFLDDVAPENRLRWLQGVREVLRANNVEVENLPGRWHTK